MVKHTHKRVGELTPPVPQVNTMANGDFIINTIPS